MCYRFRQILEKPDWNPPVLLTLEITYSIGVIEISGEDVEGVVNVKWALVGVKGPIGTYHQPEIFTDSLKHLLTDPDLPNWVLDMCYQDHAQREI
jgi:hypothetical protein